MRTMIYLDAEVHRQLRFLALDEGVSMAELIRQAVSDLLSKRQGGRMSKLLVAYHSERKRAGRSRKGGGNR